MDIWTVIFILIWIPTFYFMMKRLRRKSQEGSQLHNWAYRWLGGWVIFGIIMVIVSIFMYFYISNITI
jgi:preprotein translocase subunit YajC